MRTGKVVPRDSPRLIYRGMRHIKLFEAFNSNNLPNFRVELVKPGMKSGLYLFTCVDGSWNSFFGVFDLDGLKRLEDSMNTECVFAELNDAINYGGKSKENEAFEAHTIVVINRVNSDDKYINLHYRGLDVPFFSESPVSNVTNPPPGLTVGEDGLSKENVLHGYSVTTSKSPLKVSPEEEDVKNYNIVINELNCVDHHWSDHQRTMDYEKGFDEYVGFRKGLIEGGDYGMQEIEPYMRSIIDAGIPQGVLRTIKEIKKLNSKDSPLFKEFKKLGEGFNKLINDNLRYYMRMGIDLPERKEKAIIKTKAEFSSQIKRMESIMREVKGNIDNKKLQWMENSLDFIIKYLNNEW